MPTLSDKLKSLGVQVGAQDLPPPKPRRAHTIENVVAGKFIATKHGDAFVAETTYARDYRHGRGALELSGSLETIAAWAREPRLAQCESRDLAFLDIETTGLGGGAGTYAFLVGVGRFSADDFRVAQFFMRDPIEEPALLAALARIFDARAALVTFNGKAFDIPILNARYITNGDASPFPDRAHLDLLPLARRLWRDRLESRALGALERHILGMTRAEDEVPGWLIPQIYFDYLQTGDARPLRGVFYHNAMDVVAMAALLNHVVAMLNDPFTFAIEHGLDVIAIAKLFEDLGQWDAAARVYARGLELDLSETAFRETVRRYAHLQRRRGDLASAVELWRAATATRQVYAFVELAKHYEHRARDYAQALVQTRAALAIVTAADFPRDARKQWLGALEHRLARLERKNQSTRV